MFSISFDTDNAAFGDGDPIVMSSEIARILHEIAEDVSHGQTGGKVYDVNGNRIGSFRLEDR